MFTIVGILHIISCRQRYRGPNQRGGSRDRSDGFGNRGSSADRFPKHAGVPYRDGSSDRSEQQERFGPRRFNKDSDRTRDMGRGRRIDHGHFGKDPTRPFTTTRQSSANSTVSASRGADGRIEIAAEPANSSSANQPPAASEASAPLRRPHMVEPAAKPLSLPVQESPTSPLPVAMHSDAPVATPTPAALSDGPSFEVKQPTRLPVHENVGSLPPRLSAAEPAAQPAVPPADSFTPSQQMSTAPLASLCQKPEESPVDSALHPAHLPHSSGAAAADDHPPAQHAPPSPAAPRQPHVSPALPNTATANAPLPEAVAPQLPPHAAPLQQIPAFKPKAVSGAGTSAAQLPNGFPGHLLHQQPSGMQNGLPSLNGRSRPFTPQQSSTMHQQHPQQLHQQQLLQQQQHPQQLPRRQLETAHQAPYSLVPDPRQLQGPGMPPHMLAGQSPAAEQGQVPAGQGRVMHQPQPSGSRSSSVGQKRPMPNQDMPNHHGPPHQLTSPQQQRGLPNPSGPPIMTGALPFNGQIMPFMSSPNGMPSASMPGSRGLNSMPFLMQGSQRPSMMKSMSLMNSLNPVMGKSGAMHQHGGPPFGADPYMQMQHMQNHINPSATHPQNLHGPLQIHTGPQHQPQMQSASMQAPSFTPPHRSVSGSLSNGHAMPSQTAGLSPASSLGNSAKGSSILRATAMPFVPGGAAQPNSPMATAHSTPAEPSHTQTAPQRGLGQAGTGTVTAAPFYPSAGLTGEPDSLSLCTVHYCPALHHLILIFSIYCTALLHLILCRVTSGTLFVHTTS